MKFAFIALTFAFFALGNSLFGQNIEEFIPKKINGLNKECNIYKYKFIDNHLDSNSKTLYFFSKYNDKNNILLLKYYYGSNSTPTIKYFYYNELDSLVNGKKYYEENTYLIGDAYYYYNSKNNYLDSIFHNDKTLKYTECFYYKNFNTHNKLFMKIIKSIILQDTTIYEYNSDNKVNKESNFSKNDKSTICEFDYISEFIIKKSCNYLNDNTSGITYEFYDKNFNKIGYSKDQNKRNLYIEKSFNYDENNNFTELIIYKDGKYPEFKYEFIYSK